MERDALEREVKLEVGVGFRIPNLDGVALGVVALEQPDQHLQAVYVDTPDLRLARSGLTLRHRADRGASSVGEWTLKMPATDDRPGLTRREMTWPGKSGPVPAEISSLVRAFRRTATLGPVARLVTHRRRTILQNRAGESLVEIDDDVVSVMDGRKLAARFREVEVEVVDGAPAALLDGVVARLAEAGAVAGDGRAKLARAIGPRAAEPPDVVAVAIGRDATIGETVRAAIAQGYLRLVAHDPGIRLDEDPEDVHQARVATRRLRSDLRTFRAFLPEPWARETRDELGWLAEALGRTRDADVLLDRLRRQMGSLESRDASAAAGLIDSLGAERERDRADLLTLLNSDRYGRLLDRLADAARELPAMKVRDIVSPTVPETRAVPPVVMAMAVAVPAAAEVGATLPADSVPPAQVAPAGRADPVPPEQAAAAVADDPAPAGAPTPTAALAPPPGAPAPTAALAAPAGAPPPTAPPSPAPTPAAGPVPHVNGSYGAAPDAPSDPPGPPDRDELARKVAPAVVRGPWKHLVRAVDVLGETPADEALHEVRIRAKRLRYACEAVAEVAGRPAVTMARAAADVQGVLGDFHDAIVAEEWLRHASVGSSVPQALAAGQLIGLERQEAAACRASWEAAWERLDRKKLRAWLQRGGR